MDRKKRKDQKINDRIALLSNRAKENGKSSVDLAKKDVDKAGRVFNCLSVLGPIVVAFLYSIFPIEIANILRPNTVIDTAVTGLLIVLLLASFSKWGFAQRVLREIELSKENTTKQISSLKTRLKIAEEDQSFYVSAMELMGKSMKAGAMDLDSLAKAIVAAIYHNLSRTSDGDNFTINLYELRNGRVKMIVSSTRLRYCDRDSVDIPKLFKYEDGIDIKAESIQDYYCIKCIRGKIKDRAGKFLADQKTIVQEFKWDDWAPGEKEKIIESGDYESCFDLGFRYSQYFAFIIRRDDGIIGFFEVIARNESRIAPEETLNRVTQRLQETYYPILNILWDISGNTTGKEPL